MPTKKAPKRKQKTVTEIPKSSILSSEAKTVPLELQQWVLDIFQAGCSSAFGESLSSTIQEIKQHLFERDFAKAFSKPIYLEAYAARWSPTRALCYLEIFLHSEAITDQFLPSPQVASLDDGLPEAGQKLPIDDTKSPCSDTLLSRKENGNVYNPQKKRIVFLGAGGGAELVAFAGFLRQIDRNTASNRPASHSISQSISLSQDSLPKNPREVPFDCVFVDIADWSRVLSRLFSSTSTIHPKSRLGHPPDQRVDPHDAMSPNFSMSFEQQDVLETRQDRLATTVDKASLVTLMFTLNELYSTSLGSTTKMLLHLTSVMEPGSLLLVVDSPGSYSTVSIGKSRESETNSMESTEGEPSEKRYPMQWLLDHTLLESATVTNSDKHSHKQWIKLESEQTKWFRLPRLQKVEYPLELEDMRYQMHLYQRI